ncbi:MAG: hypothetical protein ACREUG_01180 [Steroidobacteraceae bacterium]
MSSELIGAARAQELRVLVADWRQMAAREVVLREIAGAPGEIELCGPRGQASIDDMPFLCIVRGPDAATVTPLRDVSALIDCTLSWQAAAAAGVRLRHVPL